MRTARLVRAAALVGASTAVLAIGQLPAAAATTFSDPYVSGSSGYDVSYPQCPGPYAPSGGSYSFAIIGVGGGRPFTSNSCAAAEAAAAGNLGISNVAYYFNTGYSGAYGHEIKTTCSGYANQDPYSVFSGIKGHALTQDEQAWKIGCSEALYAQSNAPTSPAPSMWWADIETGNSWSSNTTLNDFVIDGLIYEMQAAPSAGGGGIYSYTSAWDRIAGKGFTPTPAENGNWYPSAISTDFNSVSTYVVQTGSGSVGDVDTGY